MNICTPTGLAKYDWILVKKWMEKANSQNACSQKIYAKLLNNLLTNSRCKKGIYGSDQCENIGFLAQVSILHYSIHILRSQLWTFQNLI